MTPTISSISRIASLLLIVLIIAAAFAGYGLGYFNHTPVTISGGETTITTSKGYTVTTSRATTTTTIIQALSNSTSLLYELTFKETPVPCASNMFPFIITLNGTTISEPPNSNLSDGIGYEPTLPIIVFSVPNGDYTFTANPLFFTPSMGNVTIAGNDATVNIGITVVCLTTRQTTP